VAASFVGSLSGGFHGLQRSFPRGFQPISLQRPRSLQRRVLLPPPPSARLPWSRLPPSLRIPQPSAPAFFGGGGGFLGCVCRFLGGQFWLLPRPHAPPGCRFRRLLDVSMTACSAFSMAILAQRLAFLMRRLSGFLCKPSSRLSTVFCTLYLGRSSSAACALAPTSNADRINHFCSFIRFFSLVGNGAEFTSAPHVCPGPDTRCGFSLVKFASVVDPVTAPLGQSRRELDIPGQLADRKPRPSVSLASSSREQCFEYGRFASPGC